MCENHFLGVYQPSLKKASLSECPESYLMLKNSLVMLYHVPVIYLSMRLSWCNWPCSPWCCLCKKGCQICYLHYVSLLLLDLWQPSYFYHHNHIPGHVSRPHLKILSFILAFQTSFMVNTILQQKAKLGSIPKSNSFMKSTWFEL